MLLTEYEGKCLLRNAGVNVSGGFQARSADAVTRRKLPYPVAVKAQVASGGRGKAGVVIRAATPAQARSAARRILAMRLGDVVSHRRGEELRSALREAVYLVVGFAALFAAGLLLSP